MKKDPRVVDVTKKHYIYKEIRNQTKKVSYQTLYQTKASINKRLGFDFKSGLYPLETIIKKNGNKEHTISMKYETIVITEIL